MRETMIRWAGVAILAMALSACGGDDPANGDPAAPSSPPTPPSAVTAVIGPDGGTVNGPDGVQVIIPAGALTGPTTIGIARSSAGAPAMPTDNPPVGSAYEFTPHDLVFNAPVTLRMPVLAGAVGNELFMASPGGDWEVVETVVTGGVAEWQRNTFSWGMLGGLCFVPSGNTDPYPCVYPRGSATAVGTPAGTITRRTFGDFNGNAGSWVINQPGIVKVVANYRAAPDCGINGTGSAGQLKVVRWNPAVFPRVVQTIFDAVVPLTPTPIPPPIGTFSGSATLRGVGSTTVDVTAYLTDPVNAIGVSFACARPGKAVQRGGDLLTFIGSIPPPPGPFTIAGTVSGLSGAGLVLQNNGGDNLAVPAFARAFAFPATIANGTSYNVTVLSQPTGQTCAVQNASGTANANVTNVAVSCNAVASAMSRFAYVARNDGTLMTFRIDPVTGALSSVGNLDLGPSLRSVTVTPSGKFVYATKNTGQVHAFVVNAATGALTAVAGGPYLSGNFAIAVAVDPSGRFAYVANFGSNNVSVFAIDATTGALTAVRVEPTGSNPGSVTVHPSGKFAYVTNTGSANVSAYAIDGNTGALTSVPGSPFASGTDPNWVTIEPSGRFAYVANRGSNSVSVFAIDVTTGALTAVGAAVPSGTQPQSASVDPSGKFLYVSNLTSADVSTYAINGATGVLTPVGAAVAAGADAYSVTVEAGGKFAYVANFGAGNVSAYSIDAGTGALTALANGPFAAGSQPISIVTTAGP